MEFLKCNINHFLVPVKKHFLLRARKFLNELNSKWTKQQNEKKVFSILNVILMVSSFAYCFQKTEKDYKRCLETFSIPFLFDANTGVVWIVQKTALYSWNLYVYIYTYMMKSLFLRIHFCFFFNCARKL